MRSFVAVILPVMLFCSPAASGDGSELTAGDLARLERQAARWLVELEERHRPLARELSAAERAALSGYFTPELLARARLREVGEIDNPDFYEELFAERGRPLPIDFRQASGMALLDTVLIVAHRVPPDSPGWLPLLFHELVHLAQVEALGREGHVTHYVRGWAASGFTYRSIPQEDQAFELAARYAAAPGTPFSVAAEVARRFTTAPAADEPASGQRP